MKIYDPSLSGTTSLPQITAGTTETNIVVVSGDGSLKYRSDLSLQGARGTQGTVGSNGTQGTAGTQGTVGTQGTLGTQGAQGTQGRTGTQGTQGTAGSNGTQGTQGTQGIAGTNGTQGTQGTQGTAGSNGTQGTQGRTGTQGTQGTQGTAGSNGTQGTQGTQGITGTGTQGTAGTGTQGTTGAQGTAGSGGSGTTFPYTGSAIITGSLIVTGSANFTGGSGVTVLSSNADSLILTGSLNVTGSSTFTGSVNILGSLNATNNLTITGGVTTLNNGTSNRINYGINGVAAPTFTSYSVGVKSVLYDSVGASSTGYTIGIEASTMFFTAGTTSDGFKWYGGTTSAMTLSGAGILRVTSAVTASAFSGAGTGLTGTASGLSIGGNAATSTQALVTVTGTNSAELVRGNMADNDQFRILVGGTATNAGYVEIATADDGSEPIHVRQYTGTFTTLARTATLLDGSGNTSFPGTVAVTGGVTTNFTGTSYHITHRPTANATFNIGSSTGNGATVGPFVNCTVNGVTDTTSAPIFFNCSQFSVFVGYSESMRLTSGGALYIGSTITQNYSSWSDRKLKENLKIIANPLDKISKLTGYTFEWTKDSPYRNTPIVNRIQDAGLIAQDVEEVLPEIVRTTKENFKTVNYDGIIGLHTEGIKELIKQNQELLERIKQLEEKLL